MSSQFTDTTTTIRVRLAYKSHTVHTDAYIVHVLSPAVSVPVVLKSTFVALRVLRPSQSNSNDNVHLLIILVLFRFTRVLYSLFLPCFLFAKLLPENPLSSQRITLITLLKHNGQATITSWRVKNHEIIGGQKKAGWHTLCRPVPRSAAAHRLFRSLSLLI